MMCGGTKADIFPRTDAKDKQQIDIAVCGHCGLVQLLKVPDAATLHAFYSKEYRSAYRKQDTPKPKHVYRAGKLARKRLARLVPLVPKGATLLDIGAGGGEFVYLAGRIGLKAAGIDPASGYLEHARSNYQIDMRNVGIDDLSMDESYDIISVFHVLEHLRDPVAAIKTIASHLKPDGILYVEVPNLDSRQTSPYNFWFKAHLSYFSEATLRLLVEEDFEIVETRSARVLEMILRKRSNPVAIEDLDARRRSAVLGSLSRVQDKGFHEYVLRGALRRPFRNVYRVLREGIGSFGRKHREILDRLSG
jgi:2-polyprenyl-3-methyl-5-hydroxy-6-metoxy-1,4-benzoquinol methylase